MIIFQQSIIWLIVPALSYMVEETRKPRENQWMCYDYSTTCAIKVN